MQSIDLSLDGYTDLPPGKIANVATFLKMTEAPSNAPIAGPPGLSVRHLPAPTPAWYRDLYRRIGESWLWFSRAVMADADLAAILADPKTEILALETDGRAIGLAELYWHDRSEVEIAMFGVVPEATGTGAARFLMETALSRAFAAGVGRVWLHTCTFDHPAALRFYRRRGFRPYKFAIEVSDDPRLKGFLPVSAGPHVPLIG